MNKIITIIILSSMLLSLNCSKLAKNEQLQDKSYKTDKKDLKEELLKNEKSKIDDKKADDKTDIKKSPDQSDSRKIIKTGTINYHVDKLDEIELKINSALKSVDGYVSDLKQYSDSLVVEIKIKPEKFDDFLNTAGSFGKITNKTISMVDVTKEFYDLEGRVKNKKIHQERVREYLKTAKNIEELLKVEEELNRITMELESIEASYKNLSYSISYSTLILTFIVNNPVKTSRYWPSIYKSLGDFGYSIVMFLFYLLIVLLYIIGFGVPLILITGCLYIFSFGKYGLIKKLFKFLSGKPDKNK